MKIYIAGKITGDKYYKRKFRKAEKALRRKGHAVLNPAWIVAHPEFGYDDYMLISATMQKVCNAVFFLPDWQGSNGANIEYYKAINLQQTLFFDIKEVPKNTKK